MEDKLRKIFDLYVQQGLLTEGEASFEKWSKANENQQEQLFKLGQKSGLFSKETPLESFSAIWGVKKKDESEPTSQEGDMASTTPVVEEEPISSESSEVVDSSVRIPGGRRGDVVGQVPDEFGGGDITRFESGRRHRGQRSTREEEARDRSASLFDGRGGTVATGEKDTALERTFGKNQVTDFFGDIWRAGAKGIETGNTVDEAMEIMYKGKDASSQDIQDYLDASEALAERGESDEMRSFNQAFEAAGGGAWGFLMGMWDSPTAISEIAITSITQMANPASAAAAGATTAAFTGGGAGIGALAGGVGAAPGAVIGAAASIPYAIGAAGATLEAGLSFSEFLQEEIAEKGLELDEAGVRAVFADPEAMLRIRMKAAGRGVVIGVIDGLTAGVAGKIGAGITKTGVKTGKALKRSKLEALGAGTVVEGIGGGVGEATARAVVGQDMDALEIGFEMVGGGPGSILSVGPTLLGKGKYAFGPDGAPMTREEMIAMVTDTDDATFAGAKLEIKGDPGLKLLAEERKSKLRKQAGIIQSIGTELDGLSPEGRKAAIELETELSEMGSPITRKGKASKKALQDKLDALYENDPGIAEEVAVAEDVEAAQDDVTEEASDFEALMNEVSPSVEEDVTVTEEVEETTPEVEEATTEEAIQALEVEDALRERITGKPEPTLQTPEVVEKKRQELTKQKQDAIQESITEEVDVQEQTPDGQPMGEGDASGGTSIESESQTETAPTTTEEIELTAGFTEEGVEVKAPKRKGKKVNDSLTVLDQTEEDSHYGSKDFKDSNPGSDKNSHEKMLLGRAQKAVKAIQALFPGLNIVMHRSDSTYKDHVSTNSRGAFNPNTNTIHINMPKATGKTIGHEVFHAILKAKFGSEISIQRATKLMLKSLRRGINKSTSLSKEQVLQLEKYSQIFEGDQAVVQEEEFLAEFVGLLSETYTKLEVPQQTVIKKWIVKVAKMLGIPSEDVLTESDRDVIDLLNTIAGKVTEGKEIAEADIKSLEKLKDKKKPAAKKPAAKKPAAKKPAAKKPVAKKPAAKKPVAKKPVAEKPVAEKPAAKKPKALSAREKSALKIAQRDGEISIVALEKELGLGYAEAGDVIFLLEERGLVAPFSGRGEREYIGPKIKTQAITAIEEGGSVDVGEASLIQKSDIKTQAMSFPSEPGPLSFVTEKDKVDIKSLIDNIVENDETVWFWTADQLGRGEYGDVVVDKQHYLDAGPSYALDPENRKKRAVWASGLGKGTLKKGVEKSDYIFIMSGSPQASMRFNKQVFSVLEERVNQAGGFGAFKEAVMESKPVKAVREVMEKHDSFDSLKKSPDRKKLLNSFAEVETKKDTPLKRTLEKFNAFLDMDSMRDSFYRDNDFKQNDIMLVLKPTEVGGESAHSTYTTDILGEVIGVPDVKIDAADIATGDARAKIDFIVEQTGKRRAVESQVLAPYGTGPGKKIRKAPKQATIKTQAIVENTTEEVNRLKGLEKKSEDGATLNIDGTQYTGGGLVVPAASINTTQSELTPQMIEKFIADNQSKIGEEGIVKVGLYKFPGSDQVSIDLNIVVPGENREAALEFGKLAGQESLFDLDTFENVKTGATGANPISFTDPQFRQIAKGLKANKVPKVFEGNVKTQAIEGDIKTQVFNPQNTAEDIIKFGRENNFSDAAIKDYLVRVKKLPIRDKVDKKTKKVIEGVDTLMALDSIPASFGNVKGGVKVGKKLFARIEKFRAKLIKENEKRKAGGKGMPPFSEAEIMDQTIEFLESQPAYIKEGTKQKMETDQQTQMIIDMQKSLGVNPTKGMNTRIRSMRQKMMDRRKGAKGLQAVKRELRNFIRQALPTIKGDTYSKSELMKLLGKVAKADEKNINNLMEEVVDIVTTRQVKALDAKIESVLNGTYEVVQAGRLKGVKIDTDTRERLEAIKEAVSDDAMTAEDVVEANLAFNEEFNVLNEKPNQTEEDRNRMVDLAAIMSINNSKLMEDVDIDKLESLSTAEDLLADIIGEGKEAFKEQLKADHERYVSNLVRVYKAVTGETIDPSDPQVMQEAKEILKDLKNRKESRAAEKGLKKYVRKIIEKISSFKKSSESVEGLMEIIAEAPGEILGGDARKIVYEGLNAGTRVYKKRMMEATKVIQDKVKEIYGKNWRKQSRVNSVRKDTGVYRTGGKEAVERAQKKYDANPTRLNKRNLAKVKAAKTINLSPNEIAQQWQQYQDPANLPSFANEDNLYFGEDHARIMAELVETIGGEDGKILEMAKWQIEEFYPSMYPHLNEAYKNIYRTNMPWNVHYAGRIKREGAESQGLDLLGRKESFNTQVGAASTKVRIKNAKPIQPMDMMGAMVTYTTDMEWFAAMGPTIRDIDKLFSNPLMRNAIENVAGESTMRLIDHHMKNIAARGVNTERGQDLVNAMNNMFATTRLGFSPNIAIKQLTSIPTYALDIGAGNYAYHAAKNKTEFLKVFNEIRNNSVYLQDRVSTDIRQVTESYSGKQDIDFVPKSASSWFMNTMMGFIKAGDITAIYLGGMPNYSFYKAEYMKANPNATEQQAIDHAIVKFEADTKSTQQSMDLQDKDFYQTSGAFARSFNLFKTSQKQYLRKEFSGLRNMRRGFRDGNMKQAAKGAVKFATFHAMMPVLFQFIASGLPGLMSDWDEEDGEDILRAAIIGNFNSLFIAGDILQGISDNIQEKAYADRDKTLPVFSVFGEIGRQYRKYATLKDPEKKQEAFMKMMTRIGELATAGKIPMYNLRRMFMNLQKAGEAKDEREVALRLLNYSDYVIEGPGSDKDTMTFDPVSSGPRSRETRGRETRSRETRGRETRSRDRR